MKFLVQTINKRLVHDFTFVLERSQEYWKWMNDPFTIRYQEGTNFDKIKNPDAYIPVGSVDFVSEYLKKFYPDSVDALKPLNVPEQLFPYAGRDVVNVDSVEDVIPYIGISVFAKSMDVIKHPSNRFVTPGINVDCQQLIGNQISTFVDLVSEWRVFVFNGKMLDCRCYQGDVFTCPNKNTVNEMISAYTEAPKAYTIDVGVTSYGKTVVVECHRFFSCGLYGFNQAHFYPAMLSQTWYEMKNKKNLVF